MVSVEYSEAIVEVLEILGNSDEDIVRKIPNKLIEFWQKNKSTTYIPKLDHTKTLREMNLKEKTKDMITMVYINYLCDQKEKQNLIETIRKNEEDYQVTVREKYNPDNIFKKKKEESTGATDMLIVVENKESIFRKIIRSIKKFLKIY